MLENIRDGVQKPWVKIVIFAVVISFVFAGGFSATNFLGDPSAVAVVNGESISRNDFQRTYNNFKSNRADYYKASIKTEEDERRLRENILQQLITQKVTQQSMSDFGLRLSKSALINEIQSDPNNQEDGVYSSEKVKKIIESNRISSDTFKNIYKERRIANQLSTGMFATEFSLPSEVQRDYELMNQKRTGRALQIKYDVFEKAATVTDEELQQHYEKTKEEYRIEEQVSVEYVELSVANLASQQSPTEEQIQQYYDENSDETSTRFRLEEERQYSHILINGNDDAALKKANAISERIKQGEDFAAIAKTESDDLPTREVGGDLGVLLAGSLDPISEDAAKTLSNVGDVTAPIKLESAYQVLKLTGLKEGKLQPLEQVKKEIVADLSQQLAEQDFYSKSETLKEKAFEFGDSLVEAAESVGLEIKTSGLFSRVAGSGLFANQQVKDAAFSTDVLDNSINSELIEIAEKQLLVLRIKERKPSEVQSLDIVKDKVKKRLTHIKGKQAAFDLADNLLEKLKSSEEELVSEMIAKNNLKWIDLNKVERNNASLSYLSNNQFFKMLQPKNKTSNFELVEDFQNYTLLVLNNIESGNWSEADEARKKQRSTYISSFFSNALYTSYTESLRAKADVSRKLENIIQ